MTTIPEIEIANGSIKNVTYQGAIAKGIDPAVAGAALKAHSKKRVLDYAEAQVGRLASIANRKLAAHAAKEKIARDPTIATAGQLEKIDREAAARQTDRAGLFALIIARADAVTETILLAEAIEAETMGAIDAIADDDAGVEAAVEAVLDTAKAQADAAFAAVEAALSGGS